MVTKCTCEIYGQDDPDCEKHHPEVREMLVLVAAGHGEYGWTDARPKIEVLWNPNGEDVVLDDAWDDEKAAGLFRERHPGVTAPDCDLTWEQVWVIAGEVEEIAAWYRALVADLAEKPSGDDTVYDYWPSGVRLARQVAAALPGSAELLFTLGLQVGATVAALDLTPDELNL